MESSIISKNTVIEGKIHTNDLIKIEGSFKGSMIETSKIIAGKESLIESDIKVESITASGKIVGNVVATKSIDITSSGEIIGDVRTPVLNIAPGSTFRGNCTICSPEEVGNFEPPKPSKSPKNSKKN